MVAKKRKSKRTTLQTKYKIQKRTKEHHKRVAKGVVEGNGGRGKKKSAKDSIPNAWPHKEDLLLQIKAAQEKMEAMKERQKEKRKQEILARRGLKRGEVPAAMEEEEDDSKKKSKNQLNIPSGTFEMDQNHFEDNAGFDDTHGGKDLNLGKNSRRAFLKELRKTVDGSDVVLQILDARDPLGTASTAVEEMVASKANKKFVYVLNKADLVPRDVLTGWLAYLRRNHPTIPFKSNTQQGQSKNLGRTAGKANNVGEGALQTNQAVGTEELIGLLKNYSRVGDKKSVIVVGVVGFPNVGKSSLINSLMRSRAVGVSSMPGYTKVAQEVILDKNIRLMDTPGVVFADGDSASTTLRNCVNVEELEDVLTPVQAILERCPPGYLMQLYSIPAFKSHDCTGFLALVARAMGKLKKGGTPNTDAAARSVLHDWNNGKIKYYCKAPQLASSTSTTEEGKAVILSNFSEEADIMAQSLDASALRVLDELEAQESQGAYVAMEDLGDSMTYTEADAERDEKADLKKGAKKGGKKGAAVAAADDAMEESEEEEEAVPQPVKKSAKGAKKGKKGGKKEAFDFGEHF
jgi:nuclear GTP-binding protein